MGTACSIGLKHSSIGLSSDDGHINDGYNKSKSISTSIVCSAL